MSKRPIGTMQLPAILLPLAIWGCAPVAGTKTNGSTVVNPTTTSSRCEGPIVEVSNQSLRLNGHEVSLHDVENKQPRSTELYSQLNPIQSENKQSPQELQKRAICVDIASSTKSNIWRKVIVAASIAGYSVFNVKAPSRVITIEVPIDATITEPTKPERDSIESGWLDGQGLLLSRWQNDEKVKEFSLPTVGDVPKAQRWLCGSTSPCEQLILVDVTQPLDFGNVLNWWLELSPPSVLSGQVPTIVFDPRSDYIATRSTAPDLARTSKGVLVSWARSARTAQDVSPSINARSDQFGECYKKALAENPEISGRVIAEIRITPQGTVERVSLQQEGVQFGPDVLVCLERVFKTLEFAVNKVGGVQTVAVPLRFSPKAPKPK